MLVCQSTPLEVVQWNIAEQYQVSVDIKRDDLIHPVVSGNKWRKLKYVLLDAKAKGCNHLISMGGFWSNHLHALSYMGKELGMSTEAFIRGHQTQALTPTLNDCIAMGMTLNFTNRKDYAALRDTHQWDRFSPSQPGSYWIPEGGFGSLAVQGVMEIGTEIEQHYDYIFAGVGSGATLSGLIQAFPESHIVGVASFSGADYLIDAVKRQVAGQKNWTLDVEHSCGGFAKINQSLLDIKRDIESTNSFTLDRVYNAKVFYALHDWLQQQKISRGCKVLVLHTGGLQGERASTSSDKSNSQ